MIARPPSGNSGGTVERELLTEQETERLAECGPGIVSWARRVRLEQEALDQLLSGDDEPSKVLAFGRRSSAAWDN